MDKNKWLDDLYKYAEVNLKDYKRPDDWQERWKKLKNKYHKPARLSERRNYTDYN